MDINNKMQFTTFDFNYIVEIWIVLKLIQRETLWQVDPLSLVFIIKFLRKKDEVDN